ncbi:hypothetical protein BDN70DRAFT_880651 [Pholiota conissans]|uniref:BTB domain-containing protein n=1 Tax=Pholiota conissans TaxID=109636 RepID=A0A9P5YZD5_9AGAR|nr:hypothetical protein BDN70DRAFT_880651 [Pholiota conissans]
MPFDSLLSPETAQVSPTLERQHNTGSVEGSQRDGMYYFETVVFKVEDTFFCVPKNGLDVEGTPFPEMFKEATTCTNVLGEVKGSSDAYPIVINKTSKDSFRGFLRALYRFTEPDLTYEELVGALTLSTKWKFIELRTRVIRDLYPFMEARSIRERIVLATVCKIDAWLLEAFTALVLEPPPLDVTDIASFKGVNSVTIAKLTLLREKRQLQALQATHPGTLCECPSCLQDFDSVRMQNAVEQVKQVFATELAAVSM